MTGGWRDDYTRVYLLTGRAAHLLPRNVSPNNPAAKALCGVTNWPGYFRGTGAYGEREQAADMPLCLNCQRLAENAVAARVVDS